jgi:hypothetical protein
LRFNKFSTCAAYAWDGDRFWRMANCYVRGNTIKYICVPDEVGAVQVESS